MGIRCPIIKEGDDLKTIVVDSVIEALDSLGMQLADRDVVAVTESVVARSQGNYASIEDIAADIKEKFPSGELGVIFPILSRNRFAICLKGIAKGAKKLTIMLSYPSDEVGNEIAPIDILDKEGIDPYNTVLTTEDYYRLFKGYKHPFTGVDYIEYYKQLVEGEGAECEIILANQPTAILKYTENVLSCDIHTRKRTQQILRDAGAKIVYNLEDILSRPVNGSGFNENYGLLGSNKATEDKIKLFPNIGSEFVDEIQKMFKERTGKTPEVMVYGDGAFKDPVGKIWELADPVVGVAYTSGLIGTPNELKLKYLADGEFGDLKGEELKEAITKRIQKKDADLKGRMETEGTTPRRLTDLIGSLADLTSGSGDKGTPIILVKGYFDNYTN